VGPYARWELGDGLSRLSTRRRPGHSTDIKWGDARVGPASDPIPKAYRPFGRGRGILTRREGVDVRPRRAAGLPGN
jgi:hypothetical protein